MGQVSTNLLNKTIEDTAFASGINTLDSLSVRLTGMQQGSYVELSGISWGLSVNVDPLSFATGFLLIIKNEIFNPSFAYAASQNIPTKDVVFLDFITAAEPYRYLDFSKKIPLNDAGNYLIVASGFQQNGVVPPATLSLVSMTVRGNFISTPDSKFPFQDRK
ncbi:MAG TPA: hypothetical protein VH815_03130 [Acidobacteriota bacterium]|jgi:hypothetical protein